MSRELQWGVLSTAQIGLNKVIPGMMKSPLCRVSAISSRDAGKATDAAGRLGIERAYGSYEEMLADESIEAVYNPLPGSHHVEWSIRAMEAGKHVLCEKPIAMTADEARKLVDARERTGRQVLEAVMIRHHPQWQRARELVREGEIGAPCLIQTVLSFYNDDPDNIRNVRSVGGGALYDIGCYALFAARYIFETEPLRAMALVDWDSAAGTDRLTGATVDFGNGRMLSFACSTLLARYQTAQIFGQRGRIEIPIALNVPADEESAILVDPRGENRPEAMRRESLPACDQYMLQAEAAVLAFRGETEPDFPIEDAVANMAAIDALYRSADSDAWEDVRPL